MSAIKSTVWSLRLHFRLVSIRVVKVSTQSNDVGDCVAFEFLRTPEFIFFLLHSLIRPHDVTAFYHM